MKILKKYLSDELMSNKCIRRERMENMIKPEEWTLVAHKREVPQQKNSYDCGVFTCLFAEYLLRGRPMDFHANDIEFFRKRMALCTLRGELDDLVYEEQL